VRAAQLIIPAGWLLEMSGRRKMAHSSTSLTECCISAARSS
jgi:hypothetical protein